MRAVVTNGAARSANLRGAPVSGQVGTAQVTRGSKWWAHWFVGYRSGVAFAVLQLTKGSGGSAVPLGRSFLSGLGG
jgi:cell division protein FtsI/penicillin-binding protein 2